MIRPDKMFLENLEKKLTEVRNILVTEFVDLDPQIDQVLQSVKAWLAFPDGHKRPVVVNLWGMTGSGKTSLALRICELLSLEESLVYEDMGKATETGGNSCFQNNTHLSGKRSVFVLDDLHCARAFDSFGAEVDRPFLRDFWSLLDTGLILRDMRLILDYRSSYRDRLHSFRRSKRDYPDSPANGLVSLSDLDYLHRTLGLDPEKNDLQNIDDGEGWLEKVVLLLDEQLKKRQVIDFRNAIVFVTGNLDDLIPRYPLSDRPDILRAHTEKISSEDVQRSLARLFRPEQVARLGHKHLYFPSLSEAGYQKLIHKKIKSTEAEIAEAHGLSLSFTPQVEKFIYDIGVRATQGCRSVLSAFVEVIGSRLPQFVLEGLRGEHTWLTVNITDSELTLTSASGIVFKEKLNVRLEKEISEEIRWVTAVHEAGHAVTGIIALGMFPETIQIGGTSSSPQGLVTFPEYQVLSAPVLRANVTMLLGGFVAEELVFGKENITFGSSSDLRVATGLTGQAVAELAQGSHLGVSTADQSGVFNITTQKRHDDRNTEQELNRSKEWARVILLNEWELFLTLAKEIEKSGSVDRRVLTEIFRAKFSGTSEDAEKTILRTKPKAIEVYCGSRNFEKAKPRVA